MADRNQTKEKIAQTALMLFAKRGYQAVSIRDICKEVGIKESTVYYYYSSKRDLMDSLLNAIDQMTETMKAEFDQAFEKVQEVSVDAMCEVAVGVLLNYLLHPYVYPMISFLSIERRNDFEAEQIYQKIVFELPLAQQEQVFQKMMNRGYIRRTSASVLAQEYYAVILFAFWKNCMGGSLTEQNKNVACKEIRTNMKDLYKKMR